MAGARHTLLGFVDRLQHPAHLVVAELLQKLIKGFGFFGFVADNFFKVAQPPL
jgi:hypothetical protein